MDYIVHCKLSPYDLAQGPVNPQPIRCLKCRCMHSQMYHACMCRTGPCSAPRNIRRLLDCSCCNAPLPPRPLLPWRRAAAAVALRKGKSQWLFDCGEDTQRQLLKQALVRLPGNKKNEPLPRQWLVHVWRSAVQRRMLQCEDTSICAIYPAGATGQNRPHLRHARRA